MAEAQERLTNRPRQMLPPISRKAHRRALLIPLAIGIVMLTMLFVIAEVFRERQALTSEHARASAAVNDALALAIQRDTDTLGAVLKAIAANPRLVALFTGGSRDALQREAKPLYDALRRDHGITHFYFIRPDRRMFLRVQRPESFGEEIKRTTLQQAETQGALAAGLELGQKGVFTLRVVTPWHNEAGELIGYLELGKEIDRTLTQLQELTGIDIYLLIDKRFLDRDQWIDGMDMIGRTAAWDRLPHHVVAGRTTNARDAVLDAYPGIHREANFSRHHRVRVEGRLIEFDTQPLVDVGGRVVGTMILAHDLSALESRQIRFIAIVVAGSLVTGVILLLIGFRLIDHAYASLNFAREIIDAMRESASRDPVTDTLDGKAFAGILEQELLAATRYGAPCALMRIGIVDHAGLIARGGEALGDRALVVVAKQIGRILRPSDSVARHRDDEFAVALPRMSAGVAYAVAQRIRDGVRLSGIDTQNGTLPLEITVGIAAAPIHGDTVDTLLAAAGEALLAARTVGHGGVETAERPRARARMAEA